jgi:chromate reductase, NAD(P)H dehydrogenase (quinone)
MGTDDPTTITVAGLVGSLRARSFNRGLLRAAVELAPDGMTIADVPIGELPHYNEELDFDGGPETVKRFRATIQAADAILFVVPEYNYSISGVLKNAIDWASRPTGRGAIVGKPAAVMGAAIGRSGTMRAQLHLRQIFSTLNIVGLNKPEIFVPFAGEKFDETGNLTDEMIRSQIREPLVALQSWVRMLRGGS